MGTPPHIRDAVAAQGLGQVELINAGEVMADLIAHPGWAIIVQALDRQFAGELQACNHGARALEQADYAMRHGRMHGLRYAKEMAHGVVDLATEALAREQDRIDKGSAGPS